MTESMVAWKSSLIRIKSALSFAAEHPEPIARPTSAAIIAFTSLMPSPVTTTVFPISLSP